MRYQKQLRDITESDRAEQRGKLFVCKFYYCHALSAEKEQPVRIDDAEMSYGKRNKPLCRCAVKGLIKGTPGRLQMDVPMDKYMLIKKDVTFAGLINGEDGIISIGFQNMMGATILVMFTFIIANIAVKNGFMTGGQYSPMTPTDAKSTTSVYGHIERPFSIPELASAAGATYVARGTTYHTRMLEDLIADGLESHGFSVIETISACPTNFGRRNNMRSAVDMITIDGTVREIRG